VRSAGGYRQKQHGMVPEEMKLSGQICFGKTPWEAVEVTVRTCCWAWGSVYWWVHCGQMGHQETSTGHRV
jgi:hypothetical protein